jgi:hypothetical protein
MSVGAALQDLGRFLDACERDGVVSSVSLADCGESAAASGVTAEVELTVSVGGDGADGVVEFAGATIDDDGRLRFVFESDEPVVPADESGDATSSREVGSHDIRLGPADASLDADEIDVSLPVSLAPAAEADGEDDQFTVDDTGDDARTETEETGEEASADDEESSEGTNEPSADGETANTDTETDADDSGGISPRERDVPPFRDPELLAEVYESCDTFAEMTDELGMDVTPETVRRYMVDFDIHEPNSYNTGSDESDTDDGDSEAHSDDVSDSHGDDESDAHDDAESTVDDGGGPEFTDDGAEPVSADAEPDLADTDPDLADTDPDSVVGDETPVVVTDGIGLADDVTVETLVETVRRSTTVYEIKQEMGVQREDALELLRELNLLDLVVGRLATEAEREISRDEVVRRLREASATQ